jgi:hypothetical protein
MSALIEYGWREASVEMARGGFFVRVEKWWCTPIDGDGDGWRWTGIDVRGDDVRSAGTSGMMSRTAALDAAEKWLAKQIARDADLSVYAFAGLEPQP